jgi:uncharacterized protein (DUF2141 family)
MKKIKYQVTITGVNEKQQQVKIEIYASSATELVKDLKEILDKNSKNWVEKLLSFK